MEVSMEGGIVPRKVVPIGQPLEPRDEPLREEWGGILVGWIAEVDPATQGAGRSGRATAAVILPGAGLPLVERPGRRGGLAQEILQLGCRDEQGVPILAEAAAAPADL